MRAGKAATLGIALILVYAGLTGCASTAHKEAQAAPSPQNVTPGSTFTIIKGFVIPDGDTGVYFQDTHLYTEDDIQPDYPYCQLKSGDARGENLGSGVFTVTGVDYDEEGTGAKGMDVSVTGIRLQKEASGKIYRLNCMLPMQSHGARFVTPAEVQGAVDGYMTLKDAP
jgi:hypothetical protein